MERIKRELLSALAMELDQLSVKLTQKTHEIVREAVEKRMGGVVQRLERGVASGLAVIAEEVKERIDKEVKERYAKIAGETRLRLRKLESKAAAGNSSTNKKYDPNVHMKMPALIGDEMNAVQAECQKMLDKLNHQILNAKNQINGPPPKQYLKRNGSNLGRTTTMSTTSKGGPAAPGSSRGQSDAKYNPQLSHEDRAGSGSRKRREDRLGKPHDFYTEVFRNQINNDSPSASHLADIKSRYKQP